MFLHRQISDSHPIPAKHNITVQHLSKLSQNDDNYPNTTHVRQPVPPLTGLDHQLPGQKDRERGQKEEG